MRPLAIAFAVLLPTAAFAIEFPDPNLESVLRSRLGIHDRELTPADLATMVELRALEQDIVDLTGLEHATNLEIAVLECNDIIDVTALAGMTKLRELDLGDNEVIDIGPLATATALEDLQLGGNEIVDVTALASLTALTHLNIGFNSIVDISPLASFDSLERLSLASNPIVDFTPITGVDIRNLDLRSLHLQDIGFLASMSTLETLCLLSNRIADISALEDLVSLTDLQLGGNRISDLSPLGNLSNLESLSLDGNRFDDISVLGSHPSLEHVTLSGSRVTSIDTLATIPGIKSLSLSNNLIVSIEPLADVDTLDWIHLESNFIDLSPNAPALATIDALEQGGTSVFTDPQNTVEQVAIPDINLEQIIRDQVDHDGPLTTFDLAQLRVLDAESENIANFTGLEHAIYLEELYLAENAISDLSPLASLRRVYFLELFENQITSLEHLRRMSGLEHLDVAENHITDTEHHLQSLWRLEHLDIHDNPLTHFRIANPFRLAYLDVGDCSITDLSDLTRATRLEELHLTGNPNLSDLGPVATLQNLRLLRANDLPLSAPAALAPIAGLPALEILWLANCGITDIGGLTDLPSLDSLYLPGNAIADLSPLASLTSVTVMELDRNWISDFSVLTSLAALEHLSLDHNFITALPDLSGLTSLINLSVENNALTDITPLLTASETATWIVLSANFIDIGSAETIAVEQQVSPRAALVLSRQRVLPAAPELAIEISTGGSETFAVSFLGETDFQYLLFFSEDLADFRAIATPVVGDGSAVEFSLPRPATGNGFFRVVTAVTP